MKYSLKRVTTIAGVTFALLGSAPIAAAGAATTPTTGAPTAIPLFPGLSCGVNQGLFPGIPNLGPTGPLGPLGAYGPGGGGSNSNLPCGLSAFNLGPSGPLGPGGALGGGSKPTSPAPTSTPAPTGTTAPATSPTKRTPTTNKHNNHKKPHGKKAKPHARKA